MKKITLSVAEAILKFLANQMVELDGQHHTFIRGMLGILGTGNGSALGDALLHNAFGMHYIPTQTENDMTSIATSYAKQKNRLQAYACTAPQGTASCNLVSGAAYASIHKLPMLLLVPDGFASRQPFPLNNQLENSTDLSASINDCLKPVSKYWDVIQRPEQIMTALLNAFRVLTDPIETGAVTLSLPQDVLAESYEFPASLFEKRIWSIERRPPSKTSIQAIAEKITQAKCPLIIAGGGVHHALATDHLKTFANKHGIVVCETTSGKSILHGQDPMLLGCISTQAAKQLARQADLILAIGTRLTDTTTGANALFENPNALIIQINVDRFDAYKLNAMAIQSDAKLALTELTTALGQYHTDDTYQKKITNLKEAWQKTLETQLSAGNHPLAEVLMHLNERLSKEDIVISNSPAFNNDCARLWQSKATQDCQIENNSNPIAAGIGALLAKPNHNVFVLVDDHQYLMANTAILTSLQEGLKLTIILIDTQGHHYAMLPHLDHVNRRKRNHMSGNCDGDLLPIAFCQHAKSLGMTVESADNMTALKTALSTASTTQASTLIYTKICINTPTLNEVDHFQAYNSQSKNKKALKIHKIMRKLKERIRPF